MRAFIVISESLFDRVPMELYRSNKKRRVIFNGKRVTKPISADHFWNRWLIIIR